MRPDELIELRLRADLTQEELAEGVHLSRATINRWERGRTRMPDFADEAVRKYCREAKARAPQP